MQSFAPAVVKALEFAAVAHRTQLRKEGRGTPYIAHPAAVAILLAQFGFPEAVVVAGGLHDTIEDTETTAADLEREFGAEVARLVLDVTEDKQLPYGERKDRYMDHLETAAAGAVAVCAADLLANRTSQNLLLESGYDLWPRFSKEPERYVSELMVRDHRRLGIIAKSLGSVPLVTETVAATERVHELSRNIFHSLPPCPTR